MALPDMALYGEKEWYFFSPRDRKYPNSSRPNRAAGTGYWKATGADKSVGKPKTLGIKKALVFYAGRAPNGVKTNWIMHEYRLANVNRSAGTKSNLRLDDWVLCRIYNKKGSIEKPVHFSDSEDQKPNEFEHFDNKRLVISSSSEQGQSLSNYKEIQSDPKWIEVQNTSNYHVSFNDTFQDNLFDSEMQYTDQMSMFQEMFGFI